MAYCPLHVHSHYSTLDGLSKVRDIFERAKEIGAPAIAITDHASISALPELMKMSEEYGIKAIPGCEFYVVDSAEGEKGEVRIHISVWAKNWNGVQSILKQLSIANSQFYNRPRITWKQALEFEDCCIGTACTIGPLSLGDYKRRFTELKMAYGDDLYLEVMPHEIVESGVDIQAMVNGRAIELSSLYGTKIIATNDSHYTRREDSHSHEILLAIQSGKTWKDPDRWKFNGEFDIKSREELEAAFAGLGYMAPCVHGAINNTLELASKVDVKMPKFEVHLPSLYSDDDMVFQVKIMSGWNSMVIGSIHDRDVRHEYMKRLVYEVDVIKRLGFIKYFLIVEDIINWARSNGIMVGPGRGSAGGSLVCYLMGITQVDPMQFGLYFERFLNPERIDLPDIDVDFADDRREEVFDYIRTKYGLDKTAKISTFTAMTDKVAFKDVARVFDINFITATMLAKQIEDSDSFDKVPDLVKFKKEHPEIIEQAQKLSGTIRSRGIHAAGIIVSSEPLVEVAAIESRSGVDAVNWDKNDAEKFGLLKIDILGLSTLSILDHAKRIIKQRQGVDIEFTKIPLDDAKTLESFSQGNGVGVFQFEHSGAQSLLKDLKANTFEMITDTTALFRPGSLNSGQTSQYVKIHNGDEYEHYESQRLKEILGSTKGILVYQEQIMRIFNELGGFTWAQADKMRKIIGKKLGKDEFEKHRQTFVDGCLKNGVDSMVSSSLFDKMAEFAAYSFNKCISGDAVLMRCASGKYPSNYTVRDAFKIKNNAAYARSCGKKPLRDKWAGLGGYGYGMSMCEDGRIRKNKIVDIQYAGDREVYRLDLGDGQQIDVTDNHKFPTPSGKKMLMELKAGDLIYTCGAYEKTSTDGFGFSNEPNTVKYGKNYHEKCGFPLGELNPAYTNGSYTKFAQYKALADDICEHCGKVGVRIEVHHKDGNRENSDWDNLEKLCVSCHKKADYKLGRARRGEKGYPTIAKPILSITKIGVIDTYDVTMEAPNHNFVTSTGIVTCNSHAVEYTMLSFWSMYLKVHYPVEFFAAQLSNSSDDRMKLIAAEAEKHGIKIRLPDINTSERHFVIDERGEIVPPLGMIKGVGIKAVEEILYQRQEHPLDAFQDLTDFNDRVTKRVVNSRVVDTLTRAGAFSSFGICESDHETHTRNLSELLPTFNATPRLAIGGGNMDTEELKKLLVESALCAKNSGRGFMMPKFAASAIRPSIMVINNPVKKEAEHLTSDGTKILMTTLKPYGIKAKDIYYTSPTKCFLNGKGVSKECEGKCLDFLRREIKAVGPKLIVCFFGDLATMLIGEKKPSMAKLHNTLHYSKQLGCYVFFSRSPQFCYYNDEHMPKFLESMETVGRMFA